MRIEDPVPEIPGEPVVTNRKILLMIDKHGPQICISLPHGKGRVKGCLSSIPDPAAVDHVELLDLDFRQNGNALLVCPCMSNWLDGEKIREASVVRERAGRLVSRFLQAANALWRWDGHAHVALLASGKLSDCYYNMTPLSTDWAIQRVVATGLWSLLAEDMDADGLLGERNVWFIGSAMGGIWVASAMQWAAGRGSRAGYTEKADEDMLLKRFELGERPYVFVVEDVMTTGSTTEATIRAVRDASPDAEIHSQVAVVVNRSGRASTENFGIASLLDLPARTWDTEAELPKEMRACRPIRPKGNWETLTREMLGEGA